MKYKLLLFLSTIMLLFTMNGCGKEEKETTLMGMVMSVDGTKISLRERDSQMQPGERPNMENFDPENFNPEDFEGGNFNKEDFNPENFNPEDFEGGEFDPENFNPEDFKGGEFNPENFNPEDFKDGEFDPENLNREDFNPEDVDSTELVPSDKEKPKFEEGESKTIDIADAHISVEIEDGKATGSMDDIKTGSFLTITMNGKGEVTNVLVSSRRGFGGRMPGNKTEE